MIKWFKGVLLRYKSVLHESTDLFFNYACAYENQLNSTYIYVYGCTNQQISVDSCNHRHKCTSLSLWKCKSIEKSKYVIARIYRFILYLSPLRESIEFYLHLSLWWHGSWGCASGRADDSFFEPRSFPLVLFITIHLNYSINFG